VPKTARGRRRIALDPDAIATLRAHHTAQAAERLAAGPTWPNTDLVFTRQDGAPLHSEYVRWRFDRHIHRVGLPGSASTTCATPTPPLPYRRASTPRSSANESATPPWP
jgi:hypothetical protein